MQVCMLERKRGRDGISSGVLRGDGVGERPTGAVGGGGDCGFDEETISEGKGGLRCG